MPSSTSIAGKLLALAACLILAACDAAADVNATANVSARFSSVLVTVKEVWFDASATAVPADTTWHKFQLDDPVTIDLVDIMGGELGGIASDMVVPAGTYRQLRLVLASRDEDLHDSADDAGATYNNEVRWFDDEGEEQTSPLEVLNADQGIGIEMELEVEVITSYSPAGSTLNTVVVAFDAARDLTEFRYGDQTGFLLNPTLTAFDSRRAGTIRGTLNLSQLVIDTDTGRPEVQVTAQKLDEDLNRHVIVASTAVSRLGAFVLYPLPLDEDEDTTEYDLVIHGPEIETIVIRDVPVTEAVPDSAAQISLGGLAPRPALSFEANISDLAPVVPRGARIGFHQTLPDDDEPYVIAMAAVDPLRGQFAQPVVLSRANTISYGTYGASLTLRSGTPEEGAARYSVAAVSPHYGHGAFAESLLQPASPVADTAIFTVPTIGIPAGAVAGAVSATVTVEEPARYDRGVLLLTREGAVVTVASLDAILQQSLGSTFIDITQVPAGSASATLANGLYHLEAWTWSSSDPEDTFARHPGTSAIDLRAVADATGFVTIR
jgi:hypothetical protein